MLYNWNSNFTECSVSQFAKSGNPVPEVSGARKMDVWSGRRVDPQHWEANGTGEMGALAPPHPAPPPQATQALPLPPLVTFPASLWSSGSQLWLLIRITWVTFKKIYPCQGPTPNQLSLWAVRLSSGFLKIVLHRVTIGSSNSTSGYIYPKELKTGTQIFVHECSWQCYSQ